MALKPKDYYDKDKWGDDLPNEDRSVEDREVIAADYIQSIKNGKVLDIGTGDGLFLGYLKSVLGPKSKLHGVDYSKYKVKKAKKTFPDMDFKQCNLEEGIPHKDKNFDIVYAGEIIEHLYDPDLMVEEAARVLKKNGVLVVTTPNLLSWYNRIFMLFGVQPLFYETSSRDPQIGAGPLKRIRKGKIPVGHIRVMNYRAVADHMEAAGLEIVYKKGAVFEAIPGPVKLIDKLISRISIRHSSNIVIAARKK